MAKAVILICVLASAGYSRAQSSFSLRGQVQDKTGAAIAGAEVRVRSGAYSATVKTGPEGQFELSNIPTDHAMLAVKAAGFGPAEQEVAAAANAITVILQPEAARERVLVSATRTEMKLSEVPGSAVLVEDVDLAANPALTLDDTLRQVPGFQLFRRSSSRVANPTSQGVSLRGLGASGPSRALVLEDGVPVVDPFGGWVFWDSIPRESLSSVEVYRGGASNLYGSDALGGVIQFVSKQPTRSSGSVDLSYGNENTPDLSAWGGTALGRWSMSTAVDMSRTDGYILVPSSQRGAVDTLANSKHGTVDATLAHQLGESGSAFLRGTFFEEARNNGTPMTENSTGTGAGVAGVNAALSSRDWVSARLYGQAEGYDQTFSSVATDRRSETLTTIQHVPSQALGSAAQWNHTLKFQTLVIGVDNQNVMGASDEQLLAISTYRVSGGRQRTTGVFAQDIVSAKGWTIVAGGRWDDWNNTNGSIINTKTSGTTGTFFPDRSKNAFSPRLSVLRRLSGNMTFSLSGYRAFRAPTLNELYRSFRQANTATQANAFLGPERATGAEAGLRSKTLGGRLEARGTIFWTDIVDPITNVTLSVTPSLITKQRQNLGRTRSVGTELDGAVRVSDHVQLTTGYQYTHATVIDSVPALIGLNVPEVPRHQFSFEARYWNPTKLMASVQGRYSGQQYDDDLNTFSLHGFYVMTLFLGREFGHGFTGYVAAENLLNQRYATALSTVETQGPPILARVGVRYEFPTR